MAVRKPLNWKKSAIERIEEKGKRRQERLELPPSDSANGWQRRRRRGWWGAAAADRQKREENKKHEKLVKERMKALVEKTNIGSVRFSSEGLKRASPKELGGLVLKAKQSVLDGLSIDLVRSDVREILLRDPDVKKYLKDRGIGNR